MLEYGSACLIWISEVPIYYLLMSGVAVRKRSIPVNLLIGCLMAAAMAGINILNRNNGIFNVGMTFSAVIAYGLLCYHISLPRAVFFSGVINLVLTITEFISVAFASTLLGLTADAYKYNSTFLIIGAVFGRTIQILCAVLIRDVFHRLSHRKRLPIHVILFPFVTLISIVMVEYIGVVEAVSAKSYRILVFSSILMLITSAVAILSQFHFLEAEEEYQQLKEESIRHRTERDYYAILEEQNSALMIYAHDAKKHLAAIRDLNTDPQITDYVDRLSNQLQSYARIGHSGNKLLDVMLEKYAISCRQKGIRFDYDVRLSNLSQLHDMDLVAILGNLMDNAVTAAENSKEKTIQLSTAQRNSFDILVITNSCDTPPAEKSHILLSTKDDPTRHGFGTKSIRRALEKYNGDFDWEYSEETHRFTATAMIGSAN